MRTTSTPHEAWERIHRAMARPLVLDGRNLLDPALMAQKAFEYHPFGRPE